MKSIMQSKKECYICGYQRDLEEHHVFFGSANRKNSTKFGTVCWLCVPHHRGGKYSAHMNREVDLYLKKEAQKKFEEEHSHDEFMEVFGKNYL